MAAGTYNITIEQGVPFTVTLSTNISLSGCQVVSQIRRCAGDWRIVKAFNVDLSSNSLVLSLTSVETARLRGRNLSYVYDVMVYPPASNPIRLIEGTVTIINKVSRR